MTTYLCIEFIQDLIDHGDAHFAARALAKTVGNDGLFVPDADDHPYQGVKDAHIRYISAKKTAFRAIFIRQGADIYWYRAGSHAVEDHVKEPKDLTSAIRIGETPFGLDALKRYEYPRYLKSRRERYLREALVARGLIPHKSVTLVSPGLSQVVLAPVGIIGRLMGSVIDQGGQVTLITTPPRMSDITFYRTIASRGVEVLVVRNLGTRLFFFEVNRQKLDSEMQHVSSVGYVGSSELTESGLGIGSGDGIEQLCYEIDENDLNGAENYVLELVDQADSLEVHIRKT